MTLHQAWFAGFTAYLFAMPFIEVIGLCIIYKELKKLQKRG